MGAPSLEFSLRLDTHTHSCSSSSSSNSSTRALYFSQSKLSCIFVGLKTHTHSTPQCLRAWRSSAAAAACDRCNRFLRTPPAFHMPRSRSRVQPLPLCAHHNEATSCDVLRAHLSPPLRTDAISVLPLMCGYCCAAGAQAAFINSLARQQLGEARRGLFPACARFALLRSPNAAARKRATRATPSAAYTAPRDGHRRAPATAARCAPPAVLAAEAAAALLLPSHGLGFRKGTHPFSGCSRA
jgi:hypothetical protein